MPPRPDIEGPAQRRGGGGGGRGGGGGGRGRGRAGPPIVGSGSPAGRGVQLGGSNAPASHVRTVGVKRPGYGTAGRRIQIHVNACETSLPKEIIYHYDAILGDKTFPPRFNLQLIKELQLRPEFEPAGAYDGKKNLFMPHNIQLGPSDSGEFDVALARNGHSARGRPPRVYKIRVKKVSEINPEVLQRYVEGRQSMDNDALTAITALNVIVRMEPTMKYPFNSRSFFTDTEKRAIGHGLELWRGYFQSVRPTLGRMLINVDISTGMFYKSGTLIALALDFFGRNPNDPRVLSPASGFGDRQRAQLQRFISGIRVSVKGAAAGTPERVVVIQRLSSQSARDLTFQMRDGTNSTVAQYFQQQSNRPLTYPDLICAVTGSGAAMPLERCTVVPGQIVRKEIPPEVTKAMVEFSTKRPNERLQSIRQGLTVLGYGQSEYIRNFGMEVNTATFPLNVPSRILDPPRLKYAAGSKQALVTPRDGAWNMRDKRFMQAVTISRWAVVIFESMNRFPQQKAQAMVSGFIKGCRDVGITIQETDPVIAHKNPQGPISDQLKQVGAQCAAKNKGAPQMLLVVLPDGGNASDLYRAVKHFGDVQMGVMTQCLKASKCSNANPQYWANVALKVNPKLGGINVVPDAASSSLLVDPRNPAIIMGADTMHPAPGSDAPSCTALVGNVDSNAAKYVATSRVQASRLEIISDLKEMSKTILSSYMGYRKAMERLSDAAPKRLIFFRDGVSEGQYGEVMERELEELKKACAELNISPRITFIIVAKRHHWRKFPQAPADADQRSGNLLAGTVTDRDITHPLEFDFYLLSHGGLLGTSRPAHYHVLHDDNNFTADSLQSFSYTLCHLYARATRSVSIPAPVYYADIVCSRAKNHFDPTGNTQMSETSSVTSGGGGAGRPTLESYQEGYRPLHPNQSHLMYFM